MSKKKKGLLPKVEVLILLVFFLSFILWAASKCNATKEDLQKQAAELIDLQPEEEASATATTTDEAPATDTTVVSTPTTNPSPARPSTPTSNSNLNFLYITIDGLKMRTSPDLKGEVIMQFQLFEKVFFMDEITEYKDSINLGKEYAYEPWVKIKSKKGHIGWVYGAGVHYHKQKRIGTE